MIPIACKIFIVCSAYWEEVTCPHHPDQSLVYSAVDICSPDFYGGKTGLWAYRSVSHSVTKKTENTTEGSSGERKGWTLSNLDSSLLGPVLRRFPVNPAHKYIWTGDKRRRRSLTTLKNVISLATFGSCSEVLEGVFTSLGFKCTLPILAIWWSHCNLVYFQPSLLFLFQ